LHRWLDLSESAKDLVMGMLEYDAKKRLTAKQVSKPFTETSRKAFFSPLTTTVHDSLPTASCCNSDAYVQMSLGKLLESRRHV